MSALRRELLATLDLPGSASRGDLVHTTLFRYAQPLRDPAALVHALDANRRQVTVGVTQLVVFREKVFPSLDYDIVHRCPLG